MKFTTANPEGPMVLAAADIMYTFPLSYAYLAGYLKQQNEAVKVIFRHGSPRDTAARIMELKPVAAGFGNLYPELREIAETIKCLDEMGRDFPVIIGGQMVSPTPEFAVKITNADIGVTSEGEITLYKLVQAFRNNADIDDIGGLAVRDGNKVIMTQGEPEIINDLSQLPPIPFEMMPQEKWLPVGRWYAAFMPRSHWRFDDRAIPVHGGRGCPFNCNFCYHHSSFRLRPMDDMIAETISALEKYNGNFLDISDDLVLASPSRADQLINALKKLPRPVEYYLSARFDILERMSDEQLGELRATGCRIIGPGYESGSDRILKVIGKNFTAETILRQTERLKKAGIKAVGNFMVGQHTETLEDVEATFKLMRETLKIDPDIEFTFSIMTPFPGSPLYDTAKREGLLKDDQDFYDRYFVSAGMFDWRLAINMSAMTDDQVLNSFSRMMREYEEIKAASFGSGLKRITFAKKVIGQLNHRMLKAIGRNANPPKITDMIYNPVMRFLEKRELKIRNK
jgi:radical SAM superfamily enzyme YgiQ (UPF0313 family)